MKTTSTSNCPSKPTVDFLLKFVTAAINFGLGALKSQSKALPYKAETPAAHAPGEGAFSNDKTHVSVPATSEDDTHVPASYEEVVAILEEDEPTASSAFSIDELLSKLEAEDTEGDTADA